MKLCQILIVVLLFASPGWAVGASATVDTVAAFESGNKLYAERKFAEAAAAYEKITQTGAGAPALYFNLGNALFKSGQIGRAIVAYQQAQHLAPRDADILANLQFARNQVQGPTMRPTRWQKALGRVTLNEWACLAAAGVWLTFLLLAAAQIRPAFKPSLRIAVLASVGMTLVLGICVVCAFKNATADVAVVIKADTTVRTGPFEGSDNSFSAPDGAELLVLDRKGDWLQVTDDNRRVGWLKREATLTPAT